MQYKLTTPVSKEDLSPLRAGDTVLLSGTVYTARDAAHKRMMSFWTRERPSPSRRRAPPFTMWAPRRSAPDRSSAPPGPPPAAGWTPTPPACWTWASSS